MFTHTPAHCRQRQSRDLPDHPDERGRITKPGTLLNILVRIELCYALRYACKDGDRSWNAIGSAILISQCRSSVSAVTACRVPMGPPMTRNQWPPFTGRSSLASI